MPIVHEEEIGDFDVVAIYQQEPNLIVELKNGVRIELFLDGLSLEGGQAILTWEALYAFLSESERRLANRLSD